MPIYEYRCGKCDNVFEEWHKHADDITEQPCPECHSTAHRLISNTTFVLKGGGWYVTEYGNKNTNASSSETPKSTTPDASPAKETPTGTEAPPPPAAKPANVAAD